MRPMTFVCRCAVEHVFTSVVVSRRWVRRSLFTALSNTRHVCYLILSQYFSFLPRNFYDTTPACVCQCAPDLCIGVHRACVSVHTGPVSVRTESMCVGAHRVCVCVSAPR